MTACGVARLALSGPFQVKPICDTRNLMADLKADPRFGIHKTAF